MAFVRKALYINGGYALTPFACNTYTDFTVSMWVNMASLPTGSTGKQLFGYVGNESDIGIVLRPTSGYAEFCSTPGTWAGFGYTPAPAIGSWHWVAARYKAKDYAYWSDGTKGGSLTTAGQRYMNAYRFAFGGYSLNSTWTAPYFYVAEATFWSRGLTDDEVLSLYHGAFKSTANLEAYWPLNGDYSDQSGKGRTLGTVTAGSWAAVSLPDIDKYLLNDGESIKTWNGASFDNVGTYPADLQEGLFQSKGFYPLSAVTQSALDQLVDLRPKVLLLSSQSEFTPKGTRATAVCKPKLVLATGDILLAGIQNINSMSIVSTATGGNVCLIVSVDSGITWMTWDSVENTWAAVDISNVDNVISNGMTSVVLQTRTKQDWQDLVGSSAKTIRFGYVLNINSTSNVANTDSIAMSVDMKGMWREAYPASEKDVLYASPDVLRINLYANGDYKINS